MDSYSFEHNFCKYCPILIILSLLQREIIQKHKIEFPTLLIVCCCTTLKNATAYTSSQKTVEQICNTCGNFIVVTKKEILVISLTDFFDAASRRHNDVILLPVIRRVSGTGNDFVPAGQCTAHRAAHVQQLNCCVKKRQTFLRPTFGLQTAQISVLWIARSGLSCSIVIYHRQIHSVDELKRRLIDV